MKNIAARPLVLGTPWRDLTFVIVETNDAFFDLFAENWHQRQVSTRDNSAQRPDAEADRG
jgi:hypothetical protein